MEKRNIEIKIQEYLSWTYGVKISQIREDLDRVEKLGATHINIEYGEAYDTSYCDITAVQVRIETDEECQERIKKDLLYKQRAITRDLEDLKRLKLKYEK